MTRPSVLADGSPDPASLESREGQASQSESLTRLSWQADVDQIEAAIATAGREGLLWRVMILVIGAGVVVNNLRELGTDDPLLMWLVPTVVVLSAMTGLVGYSLIRTAKKLRLLRAQLSSLVDEGGAGHAMAAHPIEPVKPVQADGQEDLPHTGC